MGEELAAWQVTLRDPPAVVVPTAESKRIRYLLVLGPTAPPDGLVGKLLFFGGPIQIAERPVYQI